MDTHTHERQRHGTKRFFLGHADMQNAFAGESKWIFMRFEKAPKRNEKYKRLSKNEQIII